jgi:metal-responsive CopG/Arc/MetJ family transcriptional regulator
MTDRVRVPITVSLERPLLEPIDRICELENRPRSQLVESPLLFALEHYRPQAPRWKTMKREGADS